jgi:hypothetical protein
MKKMGKKKVRIFEEMRQSLNDALAYEQGKRPPLRVTELPSPPTPGYCAPSS